VILAGVFWLVRGDDRVNSDRQSHALIKILRGALLESACPRKFSGNERYTGPAAALVHAQETGTVALLGPSFYFSTLNAMPRLR
jgi:hypothetical protein